MKMVLATARRSGALLAAGRRTALLANVSSRTSNAVAVLPRQFSSMPPNPPTVKSRERSEFKEAKLPVDNIEFKETGILTTIDRLSNIMFMAEIFRALWLSAEVCFDRARIDVFFRPIPGSTQNVCVSCRVVMQALTFDSQRPWHLVHLIPNTRRPRVGLV